MVKQWAIADIHGCFNTFRHLIEEKIQPTRQDEVYLLGDYIDRGANPRGVIDYIISLQEKGYQIIPIMGNHEEVLLQCYHYEKNFFAKHTCFYELKVNWMYHGGITTLKSFCVNTTSEIPYQYISFFQNLHLYKETDKFVLVHAGLDFSSETPFEDTHAMLWLKQNQVRPEKINYKRLIHGHVPQTLEQIRQALENEWEICLDNGCIYPQKVGMGNLVALEMNSLNLVVQPNIG